MASFPLGDPQDLIRVPKVSLCLREAAQDVLQSCTFWAQLACEVLMDWDSVLHGEMVGQHVDVWTQTLLGISFIFFTSLFAKQCVVFKQAREFSSLHNESNNIVYTLFFF